MTMLTIVPNGDGCWPDLIDKQDQLTWVANGAQLSLARLSMGTVRGASSVAIRIDLPDGRIVVAETTMALFQAAAGAFQAADEAVANSKGVVQ